MKQMSLTDKHRSRGTPNYRATGAAVPMKGEAGTRASTQRRSKLYIRMRVMIHRRYPCLMNVIAISVLFMQC